MPQNSPDAQKFATSLHYEGELSLYTGFSHPKGWDRPKVRRFLEMEFKRQPAVAQNSGERAAFFYIQSCAFFLCSQVGVFYEVQTALFNIKSICFFFIFSISVVRLSPSSLAALFLTPPALAAHRESTCSQVVERLFKVYSIFAEFDDSGLDSGGGLHPFGRS